MSSYCKKCLKRTAPGYTLCVECANEEKKKQESYDNMVNSVSSKIKKIQEKRKPCIKCGQPMSVVHSALVSIKAANGVCFKCIQKEVEEQAQIEKERKQSLVNERIEKMKGGMSFLHITRVGQLANVTSKMKVRLFDVQINEYVDVALISSESIEVDVEGNRLYSVMAKVTGWKESKRLTIDIAKGETIHIEITSKSAHSYVQSVVRKLSGGEMVFCEIVKREFIENGRVTTIQAS